MSKKNKKRTNKRTTAMQNKIWELREEGYSYEKIRKIVGRSKSNVYNIYQKEMAKRGLIGSKNELKIKYSIHGMHIRSKILKAPRGWHRNRILKVKGIDARPIPNAKKPIKYIFTCDNCSVHLTTKNVIIYPPEIISRTSILDAQSEALRIFFKNIPKLEEMLEINLSKFPLIIIEIKKQHCAIQSKQLHLLFQAYGVTDVKDEKGKLILYLDRSKGEYHIESSDPIRSADYIDNLNGYLLEMAKGEQYSLQQMTKLINQHERSTRLLSSKRRQATRYLENSNIWNGNLAG